MAFLVVGNGDPGRAQLSDAYLSTVIPPAARPAGIHRRRDRRRDHDHADAA
jgi:hypothetical protein